MKSSIFETHKDEPLLLCQELKFSSLMLSLRFVYFFYKLIEHNYLEIENCVLVKIHKVFERFGSVYFNLNSIPMSQLSCIHVCCYCFRTQRVVTVHCQAKARYEYLILVLVRPAAAASWRGINTGVFVAETFCLFTTLFFIGSFYAF